MAHICERLDGLIGRYQFLNALDLGAGQVRYERWGHQYIMYILRSFGSLLSIAKMLY